MTTANGSNTWCNILIGWKVKNTHGNIQNGWKVKLHMITY